MQIGHHPTARSSDVADDVVAVRGDCARDVGRSRRAVVAADDGVAEGYGVCAGAVKTAAVVRCGVADHRNIVEIYRRAVKCYRAAAAAGCGVVGKGRIGDTDRAVCLKRAAAGRAAARVVVECRIDDSNGAGRKVLQCAARRCRTVVENVAVVDGQIGIDRGTGRSRVVERAARVGGVAGDHGVVDGHRAADVIDRAAASGVQCARAVSRGKADIAERYDDVCAARKDTARVIAADGQFIRAGSENRQTAVVCGNEFAASQRDGLRRIEQRRKNHEIVVRRCVCRRYRFAQTAIRIAHAVIRISRFRNCIDRACRKLAEAHHNRQHHSKFTEFIHSFSSEFVFEAAAKKIKAATACRRCGAIPYDA